MLFVFVDEFAEQTFSRRHSFRLRAGHKAAHLYSESTEYHYMKKLEAPKAWFKANADSILKIYGQQHGIQKEDLFLGIYFASKELSYFHISLQ